MNFSDKKVLVCGMARSGISVAELINDLGGTVTLQDLKSRENLGDVKYLEDKGIVIYSGKNPDDIILDQDLIIISPGIPCDLPFIVEAEKNNIPVLSEVEISFRLCKANVVAITGTNGKTTTTTLVGEMFKSVFPDTAVVGNIGIPFSSEVKRLNKDDWAVAEISSFQMEKAYSFKPKISAVLNITPDHLNRHKTMETYIAMKERVFKNQDSNDYLILNHEDEVCRLMSKKANSRIMFFSSTHALEEGIYLENDNIIIKWKDLNEIVINISDLQILGLHNYENVMAAVGISVCAGISLEKIREVLKSFKGVEHRIEYVSTVNGIDFYNDSKGTNPDASIRAVCAMIKPTVLIAGGMSKGSEFDDFIKVFNNKIKAMVVLGETADKIAETAKKYGFTNTYKVGTLEEAVDKAYSLANTGDCVLLSPACASWDMFESYEQRGNLFKFRVYELSN